ncbi:MAG: sel1 repeat family protein, partial [Lentisphaeria bacterium]|nr:sel1 repeat family protein [Lentisphaeria bacterium]
MMNLKHILSAVLFLAVCVCFADAHAGTVSAAISNEIAAVLRMKEHTAVAISANPASAVRQLGHIANKDGQAAALYGICLKEGFGIKQSLPEARKYFARSASMGNALGQFWAGYFMLRGVGGVKDVLKGVDLLESAAVQGISDAMLLLSRVYLEGYSVKGRMVINEDHPLALRYLRRAAAGGNKNAAMLIGDWFLKGGVIVSDPVQAREWFVNAAGHVFSEAAVAEVDYLSAAAGEAKDAAWAKLVAMAGSGNARAAVFVGRELIKKGSIEAALLRADIGVKKNYPPAFTLKADIAKIQNDRNWFSMMQKAADMGDPDAMAAAGFVMATAMRGRDSSRGLEILERAARSGVIDGKVKMGRIYLQGRLVPKDEMKAYEYFKYGSERGNVEAKYYLALCLRNGWGCRADLKEAAALALAAADAGDSYAQLLYGTFLRDGIGVPANTVSAMNYFERSAKQGNKHAKSMLSDLISKARDISADSAKTSVGIVQQSAVDGDVTSAFALGNIYTEGSKLPRDYKLGRKNLEIAVSKKYAPAYAKLAEYYLNGWGVSKDYKKAHAFLNDGYKLRSGECAYRLGICKLNGVGTKKDVPGAIRYFRQAAAWGCSEGELWLGVVNSKGIGMAVNEKTAYNHYRKAMMMGNDNAMLMLAICFKDGFGVARNPEVAFTYFEKAAQSGNSNAMYELGLMYANGIKGKKDLAEAVKYYKKSAEAGNTYGIYELACCYENGRGVAKDLKRAAALFRIAASAGNCYAQFMLARCYEGGIGVPQDKYEAVKWYRKAAAGGFKYAGTKANQLRD